MMRLIEHHQVPAGGVAQSLDPGGTFQGIDAGYQPVMLGEGIGPAVGDVTLGTEDLKVQVLKKARR